MTAASDTPHHKERFDELDGVRAISILCVLAAHLLPLGTGAWVFNDAVALAGMSLFFCLSGFLITYFLWQNQDIRAFLIRRCARIVPLILLFSFILCILVWQRPDSFLIINLYVLNYVDWAFVPGVTPLWSVALEMQFYLVIALAVGVFGRRGFWVVPVIALAVMIFRIEGGAFSAIRTHLRVDEIMSGCLLALLWLNKDQARFQPLIALLRRGFWVFLILWALSTYRDLGAIGYVRPYAAAGLVGAVLFMEESWQRRFLRNRVFKYIAAVSFALYVWHSAFRIGWFAEGGKAELYLIKRPITIALSFVVAHVSTFYFEKYFTDKARTLTAKRPTGKGRPETA